MRNRYLVSLAVIIVTASLGLTVYSGFTENAPPANAAQPSAAADLTWQFLQENWSADRSQSLYRAKVPGGWLLRVQGKAGGGITFYPDPAHKWNGASVP